MFLPQGVTTQPPDQSVVDQAAKAAMQVAKAAKAATGATKIAKPSAASVPPPGQKKPTTKRQPKRTLSRAASPRVPTDTSTPPPSPAAKRLSGYRIPRKEPATPQVTSPLVIPAVVRSQFQIPISPSMKVCLKICCDGTFKF